MLYTIAVILIILWLLGLVTSYTLGGFIHILLVVAIVAVLSSSAMPTTFTGVSSSRVAIKLSRMTWLSSTMKV